MAYFIANAAKTHTTTSSQFNAGYTKIHFMKNTLLIGSLAIFATTSVSTATIQFIDDFTEGTFNLSQVSVGSVIDTDTGLDTSKTIGGVREARAHVTANTGANANEFKNIPVT